MLHTRPPRVCWCGPVHTPQQVLDLNVHGRELSGALPDGNERDPNCEQCDTDTHICPGCGAPIIHGMYACTECAEL